MAAAKSHHEKELNASTERFQKLIKALVEDQKSVRTAGMEAGEALTKVFHFNLLLKSELPIF